MTDPAAEETMTATAFKARCLEILDRLSARALRRVTVTKRGRVVAVLTPPSLDAAAVEPLYGCMRGSVRSPTMGATGPDSATAWLADPGPLHR
ncbi:MAG: hypothetical protein BGO51_15240 [Rhodospirillales bacterium 69-11]|jgi:antitoxin (DNA-binding transcriptional repressor) of toxin-antitoxin stability system|nr:hypothetical protein [Rhodospirillales bacterium]OJW22111.1 MAG: hypothetical protein BGO51_15240 [Rhodospirillales bacterium 69-11]